MRNTSGQTLIGVDIGGTFTDVISFGETGELTVVKLPTSKDPAAAVVEGLRRLGEKASSASVISHATTLATNALLTRSGLAKAALITNAGFRDVLEIGRQRRPEVYDLNTSRPTPLVRRKDRMTVNCRISADGSELEPLDEKGVSRLARQIVKEGFESVAVSFLNSYVDPGHELRVREILRDSGFKGHISLSSEVDREYREFERTSTTVVNACLAPMMSEYLSDLTSSLGRVGVSAPVYVMNSDGGMGTASFASDHPVSTIESGPAAGVVASRRLAHELSLSKILTFDMGGTTAKAGSVVDGEPSLTEEFEAAGRIHSGRSIAGSGYPVRGTFIDLAEVSAGGGTVAWRDEAGQLRVGPLSSGSNPGPACYGKGGKDPTVTDANVILGRLNPEQLLGGEMKIYSDLSFSAFRRMDGTGSYQEETARGVVRLVNDLMAKAISIVSVEKGMDPRDFSLIAFGGAGPVHACDLAEELGMTELVIPSHAGLFSAYGLLAGDLSRAFTTPVMRAANRLSPAFAELERSASKEMRKEGFREFKFKRAVEARYQGQSHELRIPFDGDSGFRRRFDERHRNLYGYSSSDPVQAVKIVSTAVINRKAPPLPSSMIQTASGEPSSRAAWVGGRNRPVKVYQRERMPREDAGRGPCIIEEYDSTLVVNPGWKFMVEPYLTRLSR